MSRIVAAVTAAAIVVIPAAAQAGPVDCVNEKFWQGRIAECPGDSVDCVNTYFWHGRILECV